MIVIAIQTLAKFAAKNATRAPMEVIILAVIILEVIILAVLKCASADVGVAYHQHTHIPNAATHVCGPGGNRAQTNPRNTGVYVHRR
jgi:hypothetical protein